MPTTQTEPHEISRPTSAVQELIDRGWQLAVVAGDELPVRITAYRSPQRITREGKTVASVAAEVLEAVER